MEHTAKHFRKRDAILSCLRGTTIHPSAEMVHDLLQESHPDISLATVYRNLSLFKAQGTIQSLGMIHGMDLHQMDAPQRLCNEAAQHIGGQVDSCQLMFFGTCRACLAKQESA